MKSVVGIFNSLPDAVRAAASLRSLGILDNRIGVVAPGATESEIQAIVPTTEAEQPGMGEAIGGTVGAAIGIAGGATAGAAVASLLLPGVGPVIVLGLIAAAVLGTGAGAAGALAGEALEAGISNGLPRDELYVYEEALRRGRSVVIAFADDEIVERAQTELERLGAESVNAARDEWWIGLRGAEQEHYLTQGGNFGIEEAVYRLGFESALHPERKGRGYEEVASNLQTEYGDRCDARAFREGYARGQAYCRHLSERVHN
jgi:hypothetical protein